MIAIPTRSLRAAAEQLLADPGRWSPGRSKQTGQSFWLVEGSQSRSYFMTSDGCSCPGYRHRGVCSHQVAAIMRTAREASRQAPCELPVMMTVRDRYSVLFPED